MKRLTNEKKLIKEILDKTPDQFELEVNKAIDFLYTYLKDQKRESGESFVIHSLNVARNCCLLKLDTVSIITSLLHQTFSKRFWKADKVKEILKEIEINFGTEILDMLLTIEKINSATKMNKRTDFKILKRYFVGGVSDLRPVLIKICDIFDDALTIEYLSNEKQRWFSEKLYNLYSPLCDYLNIRDFKNTLEDIAFKTTNYENYKSVDKKIKELGLDDKIKNKYIQYLRTILDILEYNSEIKGRIKGHYSIYRKNEKYSKEGRTDSWRDIKDILAFRIIVKTIEDCYKIAHAVEDLTEHNPDYFDDYILIPKPNGYRAIHLCIKVPEISDIWVELQILTHEMDYINSYGPASHISYKANLDRFVEASDEYDWVRAIHTVIDEHINKRETEKSIPILSNIFNNQIFVETPQGKIIQLEKDSTCIDFAYKIHTEVGNSAVSAKVNRLPVRLSHILKTGDIVEIVTRKNKTKPDIRMLEFAKSNTTRKLIRENLT